MIFRVFLFRRSLDNLGIDWLHFEILHESTVLEHGGSALEVAIFDFDVVAADAARWLLHM